MKHVAVLGGGPAGAFAAERLAAGGLRTTLLDEKLAWEKPCGGGLTYKAYTKYPFLIENDIPKKLVSEAHLSAPGAGSVKLTLPHPMVVYSRIDLNQLLLDRAIKAGAAVEKTRVVEVLRRRDGWRLKTQQGDLDTDFCVVATGARNSFKDLGTKLTADDTMQALGYYVPSRQEHVDIQFLPQFEGYIWVFPRCGHLSVGICGKGHPAKVLRERLELYMQEKGIRWKGGSFYSHVLPSLALSAWRNNRVAGSGWIAVGDAGGFVDPVTGEGIYYALRSADLASQIVLSGAHSPADRAPAYRTLLDLDFATNLMFGAMLAKRLFLGKCLCGSVPVRIVQVMRRSPKVSALMQDLFIGTQSYLDLKTRLLRNLHGTLLESVLNFMLSRLVPGDIPA